MRTQLFNHNKTAYQKVMRALETADRTCVVHPTGTGKSYLIAAVSESYKHVLIIGPNTFVLDQVNNVLKWRKHGVEYMTYQTLTFTERMQTDYDLIVLDEFHRSGAQKWGTAVDRLLELNTHAKVLGTSATPVRYLDNERDMADELFGGNIASYLTIADAWNQSILPIPRYVSGLFRWDKTVNETKRRIEHSRSLSKSEKRQRIFRLANSRLHWELSYGMPAILRKHLDRDARRVIVFCGNIEGLEQMRQEVVGWFRNAGFTIACTCIIHSNLSDREQHEQMDMFERDDGDGVRLMFSVNMLNEGVHVPNVNAVLMLRTTSSRIIYMQQMGRCLTVANTKKPLVLDMVDNITTTTAIKDLQEEFDMLEKEAAEREGREPHRFEVTDYTLGVKDLIEKLVRDSYTIEERLKIIDEFAEQNCRLPMAKENDFYRHWAWLVKYRREDPRVQSLIKRFHKYMTLDDIKEHLLAFAAENGHWPRVCKPAPKGERSLYRYFDNNRDELLKDESFRQMYEYYRDKDKPTFDKYYPVVLAFCTKYGKTPNIYSVKGITAESEEEEKNAFACWRWLRKNYLDDERVIDLHQRYNNRWLRESEIKHRIELLTAFVKKNKRLPHNYYPKEVKLQSYMNSLRQPPYNEREDVKELERLIDSVRKVAEDADELLEEYIRFCETNGKIPSKHSKDAYEVGLYKRTECRKSIKENPRYLAVRDKYKRQRMSRSDERRIVTEHCERTGRRPSKKTCSEEVYRAWQNIKRTDKDFANKIQEKYPAVIVWSDKDIERYADQMIAFVKEHNRRPNVRLDEHRLCNIFGALLKNKGDHPAVVRLREALAQLPPPVYSPKFYNVRQRGLRSHCGRYGYVVVKDRGSNPATRYVIFYTSDTRRNDEYEKKCLQAGLEIREYETAICD